MALVRRCSSMEIRRKDMSGEEESGFEFVRYTSFGRKRVSISKNEDPFGLDLTHRTPLKRLRSERLSDVLEFESEKSSLETLPLDILIRIVCGVNHEDLKQLFLVSKMMREAALIAKEKHFAYSTPTTIKAFRTPIEYENPSEFDEIEAPNAPKQSRRCITRLNRKKLAEASTALFSSPKKGLFIETEV